MALGPRRLHHHNAEAVKAPYDARAPASVENYEAITLLLLDLLTRSGYVNERTSKSTELKMRRLVRRLGLPISDAQTWLLPACEHRNRWASLLMRVDGC